MGIHFLFNTLLLVFNTVDLILFQYPLFLLCILICFEYLLFVINTIFLIFIHTPYFYQYPLFFIHTLCQLAVGALSVQKALWAYK